MLEGNLGCLYANLLLQAGGSDQIAEGFEVDSPTPGWTHTTSGSSSPVPDCPQGENCRALTSRPSASAQRIWATHEAEQWRAWLPVSDSLLMGPACDLPTNPSLLQAEPAQPLCKDMLLHLPSPPLNCTHSSVPNLVLELPKYAIHLKLITLFLSPSSPL